MKKFIGFIIVLSLFILGGLKVQAAINLDTSYVSNVVPSIAVLSPNGGEIYQIGSTNHLTWSMSNFPFWDSNNQSVQIQLWDRDGQNLVGGICVSCTSSENGGSYNWTIGQVIGPNDTYVNVLPGQYKIRISTVSNVPLPEYNYTLDFSDRPFTVTKSVLSTVLPDGCNSAMGFSPTTGLPCFLDTYSATSVTKNGAVLNGRLIANAPAEMYFTYNKTGNGYKVQRTPKIAQQSNGLFSYTLSSLSPNTSYDFKACMYYAGAERCAKQLTFKTFPASYIQEKDDCKNSEIYSSTAGQKCFNIIEVEQKCDPTTDCYKKEIPIVTTQPCNSATGCPQKETHVVTTSLCNSPAGCSNTSSQLTRTLKIGTKGEDVKYIQTLLGITADGSYGPVTVQKVKEWQAKNMLKADGIFGAQSMSIISQ